MSTEIIKKKTLFLKKTSKKGVCRVMMPNWTVSLGHLLDQHSLIGQQLQLNPATFWSTQVGKLLQHVNICKQVMS